MVILSCPCIKVFTQQRSDTSQDSQQGGSAEPRGRQRGLLRETHRLPLPVPLALSQLVLLFVPSLRPSSQAGTDGHSDRPGAGEARRPVAQHQGHVEHQGGVGGAGQRLELGQQHQCGCGAWRSSRRLSIVTDKVQCFFLIYLSGIEL